MYFDLRPKTRLKDFYDREEELKELRRGIEEKDPLILVLGLRRYGKTSLVLTCLEEYKIPYVYLNCRLLPSLGPISPKDLALLLAESFNKFLKRREKYFKKIKELLEKIEEISVAGFEIRVKASKAGYQTVVEIIESINELDEHIVVVIDEAQELRRLARYRFDSLLAYIYDHLSNITVVLTGSEIGLLYKLIRKGDPEAPLYGRAYHEIILKPLTKEQSKDFLIKGFKQKDLDPPDWFIEAAVEKLDGVIGWLSYLGYYASRQRKFSQKIIEEVLQEASKIALAELERFLALRPLARKRYITLLKEIALLEKASWSKLYKLTQAEIGKIPKPTFNQLLRKLLEANFITKENNKYKITDPVLQYALKHLTSH